MIDQIVVTGDIFRVTENKLPLQLPNATWLYNLLNQNITDVTDIPVIVWFGRKNLQINDCIPEHYWAAIQKKPSIVNWAKCYFTSPTEELIDFIGQELGNSLVFSMEMSYLLKSALDNNDIPWIDMNISPIRFLEDLEISFHFSHHFNLGGFDKFFTDKNTIENGIQQIRKFYGNVESYWDDSILFFAQTGEDCTLIDNNGFYSVGDVLSNIENILSGKKLFVKAHPFYLNNPIIDKLIVKFGASNIDAVNTYAVLAKSKRCVFTTIASSVGSEAIAFGHESILFNTKMYDWIKDRPASLWCYRDNNFWQAILSQVIDVKSVQNSVSTIWPHYLRKQIGYFSIDPTLW